jgi:putative ABC transport system ATP-binding protein
VSRDGVVAFRGVSRTYGEGVAAVEALHAVDGTFARGAVGALVGPSGCGKSTLLRILGGIEAADTGAVDVDGIAVLGLRSAALRRYRSGTAAFVTQRAAASLIPHLSVREQLGADGIALADEFGLHDRLDANASQLSGGEQARAALAVALARRTHVVLLDEPTAELDRDAATHVIDALRRAADGGRTIVVATHDPDLIEAADDSLVLTPPARHAQPATRDRVPGAAVVSVNRVTKDYAGARALSEASLEVRAGELSVLVGRSGSGKSTLLMCMGGWIAVDEGEVLVPGSQWEQTAYLPQRFGLLPELSIAENVGLPLRLRGMRDDRRVADVLERLGLRDLANRLPSETSIGQQQRTAVARTLVVSPIALLADEPTSHQDAGSATLVWQALEAACAAGTACLVATHDDEAVAHADSAWRIDDGRVARL